MIVWGGNQGFNNYYNDGGLYNPKTDSWATMSTGENLPPSRAQHSAVWTGSEMIVWGGRYNYNGYMNNGGRYDPDTDSWRVMSTGANVPSARAQQMAVWADNQMIVWGGDNVYYNFIYSGGRYHPETDTWNTTSIGADVPAGRYALTGVWTGNTMIIWGGIHGEALNSGGIYTAGSSPSPGNTLRGTHSSFIRLNWGNTSGAGSYNVKRCNADAGPCIPGTIVSTPTINQYSEPDDGLSHFYAVEAVNQCGATP